MYIPNDSFRIWVGGIVPGRQVDDARRRTADCRRDGGAPAVVGARARVPLPLGRVVVVAGVVMAKMAGMIGPDLAPAVQRDEGGGGGQGLDGARLHLHAVTGHQYWATRVLITNYKYLLGISLSLHR